MKWEGRKGHLKNSKELKQNIKWIKKGSIQVAGSGGFRICEKGRKESLWQTDHF